MVGLSTVFAYLIGRKSGKRLKYIINDILLEERNMKRSCLALLLGLTLCLSPLAACGSPQMPLRPSP